MIRDLIEALLDKQYVVEFRASNQRPQIMGNRIEMEIAKLVQQNKTLLKLGLNFDVPDARHRVATQLQMNNDNCKHFEILFDFEFQISNSILFRSHQKISACRGLISKKQSN